MAVLWISHGFNFNIFFSMQRVSGELESSSESTPDAVDQSEKSQRPFKKGMKCYVAEEFLIGCANMFLVWFMAFRKPTSYNISVLFDLTLIFVCKNLIASSISIHYGT